MDGEAIAGRLTNTCETEQKEQREALERSLTKDEERIEVLDKMVLRLCGHGCRAYQRSEFQSHAGQDTDRTDRV